MMVKLLERCWFQDPSLRPEFSEIVEILQNMANKVTKNSNTSCLHYAILEGLIVIKQVTDEGEGRQKGKAIKDNTS